MSIWATLVTAITFMKPSVYPVEPTPLTSRHSPSQLHQIYGSMQGRSWVLIRSVKQRASVVTWSALVLCSDADPRCWPGRRTASRWSSFPTLEAHCHQRSPCDPNDLGKLRFVLLNPRSQYMGPAFQCHKAARVAKLRTMKVTPEADFCKL